MWFTVAFVETWNLFLAFIPKSGLCDLLHVCVSVCLCIAPINFWIPEPVFKKLGMLIMVPEPISAADFTSPFHPSVCLYVFPYRCLATARYKRYCGNEYTCNNRNIVGRLVFSADRVVSKESRRLILPRTSCWDLKLSRQWLWRLFLLGGEDVGCGRS
jgi:hypothetical protein